MWYRLLQKAKMLLLFILLVLEVSADYKIDIGTCKLIDSDKTHVFDKLAAENDGRWQVRMVPKTPDTHSITWMSVDMTHDKAAASYKWRFTTQIYDYKIRDSNEYILTKNSEGQYVSSGVGKDAVEINILNYKPKEYAYGYACSKTGGSADTHFRFVLAHEKLTDTQKEEINTLEKNLDFNGELWYIE